MAPARFLIAAAAAAVVTNRWSIQSGQIDATIGPTGRRWPDRVPCMIGAGWSSVWLMQAFFLSVHHSVLWSSLSFFIYFWWQFGSSRCHASAKQRMRAQTEDASWVVERTVLRPVRCVDRQGSSCAVALLFQICGLHEAVAFVHRTSCTRWMVAFVHRTSCTRWMWLDSCGASLQNFMRRENCGCLSCHAHSKMFDGRPAAEAFLLFIVERRLSSVLPAHESPRLGNGLTSILPCDRFKWSSILRLTSGFHAQRGQLPREREKKES